MSRRSLSFQPSLLQNWLKKDGEWIRLTSRFIAEMEPYLKEVHGNEIAECRLCKKTVIRVSSSALISVRRHALLLVKNARKIQMIRINHRHISCLFYFK